jgi:hypothetical protein
MEQRARENGGAPEGSLPAPPELAPIEEPKESGSSNETDEVVKRLLQKREQELNK